MFKSKNWLATALKDMWDLRGRKKCRYASIDVKEKEELGNYQPINILSRPRKMLKQQVEQTIFEDFEDQKVLSNTKHRLVQNKS